MQTLITKMNEEIKIFKIHVELLEDIKTINQILDDPFIYQMCNGVAASKPINTSYREELTKNGFSFLSISMNQDLIGVFSYREVTKKCVEVHIHMLPEAHKKGYGKQAVNEGIQWFSRLKSYKTVITYVPQNCFHVLKFMKDNQFEACGMIPEAIIYKNELVSLYVFNRGL